MSAAAQRLATRLEDWDAGDGEFATLVIGSGYGGAVAALRLAEAGEPVLVLERGSEFLPGEFPNDIAQLPKYLRAPALYGRGVSGSAFGLFDWHVGSAVLSLTANGLGGGSLINAGVVIEPDADVLQQPCWPAPLRSGTDVGETSMPAAFARARQTLGSQRWHDAQPLAKSTALERLAPLLQRGAAAAPVDVTIDPARCTRCGDCATGCNVPGAKRTLRDTYLAGAVRHGARLVCGASAYLVSPLAGGGWQVWVMPTQRLAALDSVDKVLASRHGRALRAARLVIAAGTFGSTELLQRSREHHGAAFTLSPALGQRFSGNGDSLGFIVDDPEPVLAEGHGAVASDGAAPVGPTITRIVDLRRETHGRRRGQPLAMAQRLIVEDGATPGALLQLTREMLATAYTLAQSAHFGMLRPRAAAGLDLLSAAAMGRHTQLLLTMGHDGSAGHLVRIAGRDTTVPYWPGALDELPTYRQQARLFDRAGRGGGVHLHAPNWQLLPRAAEQLMSGPKATRTQLTVHPLGGCPMADRFEHGVVDHRGRVWRSPGQLWPGLYVLDGSIVPTSLGVNPLLTITALAERAMCFLVRELRDGGDGNDGGDDDAEEASALRRAAAAATREPAAAAPADARALPLPQPPQRDAAAEFDVSLFERLVCLQPLGRGLADALPGAAAELRLELGSAQWSAVWNDPAHRVDLRRGRLRLQSAAAPGDGAPRCIDYDVIDGWFELLPAGRLPFERGAGRGNVIDTLLRVAWLVTRHLNLVATWWLQRGRDDLRRSLRDGALPAGWPARWQHLRALLAALMHAAERRTMRYELQLVRRGEADAPRELLLLGSKPIGYAAGWAALARWWWLHRAALRSGRGVPPPRPTFWSQVTDPRIVLLAGASSPRWRTWLAERWPRLARAWGHGRFEVDAAELLAQAPLLLHRGDLTGGIVAQAAYPLHFLRYALKTHLFELRLPDYSGSAPSDGCEPPQALEIDGVRHLPEVYTLPVRRGRSEGEDPLVELPTQLELRLWCYRRFDATPPALVEGRWNGQRVHRARSVLLLHAFAQSGGMYTLPELQPNLARVLVQAGFDVWILEHRISTRLPYTIFPSTIDQIARHDIPAAVQRILRSLREGAAAALPAEEPLQIFAFGQCIGGAALAMSLLDGQLAYPQQASGDEEGELAPRLPMLAGAVISQTHPFLVGSAVARAKTWIPGLLRNLLNGGAVPLAVRGPVDRLAEAWTDRLLASLPVPPGEHCPHERDLRRRQDACATCRRIRFIEAPLFKHANLDDAVHDALPRLFGAANLQLFAHAALCVEHERLVDNDGRPVYVHDERMRRFFALPLAFLHGADNELFDAASARRSAAEYARLFPRLARQVEAALGQRAGSGAAWIVDGLAHVDVIIGRDAPAKVFAPLARFFGALLDGPDPLPPAPPPRIVVTARPPRAGPWVGDVQHVGAARWHIRVSFLVDDRYSEGKAGHDGAPGTRSWAFVLLHARGDRRRSAPIVRRLAINAFQQQPVGAAPRSAGYRIAHGEVVVDLPGELHELQLRGFTVHEALLGAADDALPGEHHEPRPEPDRGEYCAAPPALAGAPGDPPPSADALLALLIARARHVRQHSRRSSWIVQRNVSRQRREARALMPARARLARATLAALARAPLGRQPRITFAAASCRYPGMAIDAPRVDAAARELLAWSRAAGGTLPVPAFALLLGDQIYADATAGIVDSDNPLERFAPRHAAAFAAGRRDAFGRRRGALGDLLGALPTYLTQDDHEYRDGWPGSGPLEPGRAQGRARDRRVVRLADDAVTAFQRLQMPGGGSDSSYAFEHGPLRCFVLDTRSRRSAAPQRIVDPAALARLSDWYRDDAAAGALNVIATGSVLLPRLLPGCNPADPGEDTLVWHPPDREALLALLAGDAGGTPRRFLLLSGDYHVSAALRVRVDGAARGAAIVVPPLYAPLAWSNTTADSLWCDEPLERHRLQLEALDTADGSGFAAIDVQRRGGGFRISVVRWLHDHAAGAARGAVAAPLVIDLA